MYIEILKDSRAIDYGQDNVTQTFAYIVSDCDLDDPFDQPSADYGVFFAPNDDIGLLKFIEDTFPASRVFYSASLGDFLITLISFTCNEIAPNTWKVILVYGIPNMPESPYVQFSLQAGGETTKILKSRGVISQVSRTGSALLPPETHGAIGLTATTVEGADVYSQGIRFGITNYYSPTIWDTSIIGLLGSSCPAYNSTIFLGRAVGEVLIIDASANGDPFRLVPVTFNMSIKPNANGITDAGFPALFALGHDIIDYRYIAEVSNQMPVRIPMYRYVHRAYTALNFSVLGL